MVLASDAREVSSRGGGLHPRATKTSRSCQGASLPKDRYQNRFSWISTGSTIAASWRNPQAVRDTFSVETVRHPAFDSELSITFGPQRSTLGNLPESPDQFPVATHVKRVLDAGVKKLFLDSRRLREASPPGGRRSGLLPDGSNLPWAVQRLREADLARFEEWLEHVRTALRELEDVRVVEREDDRHAYLMLRYSTGVEVPSWTVSDGTLRLLALTLAAHLPDDGNVYLMEEPENGIHPLAVETVYQSLSSVYDSQVMVATHSPVLLRCAHPEETLCFAKNRRGRDRHRRRRQTSTSVRLA